MLLIKYSTARAFTKAEGNMDTQLLKVMLGLALFFRNGAPASWKEGGGWGMVTWEIKKYLWSRVLLIFLTLSGTP